jgi:dTDP-L-rhamnose 4-epimerase
MNKKVLITGGAGFIGSKLANELVIKEYIVTVIDNLNSQIHGTDPINSSSLFRSLSPEIKFIYGDVTDRKILSEAIKGQNIIIHLAAETGTGQSMYEIERYNKVNIGGTALLLDILANSKNDIRKVLIASSRAIYGEGKYFSEEQGIVYPDHRKDEDLVNGDFEVKYPGCTMPLKLLPTDENSKIHPSSVYGITKHTQEQLVMTVTKALGINGVSFRYQNVYGPGQSLSNPYTGILSIFSTRIMQKKPINIFEDGLESRDFVFIDDVVSATILGIEKEEANNQVFNVGSGQNISVKEVVNKLVQLFNIDIHTNISGNYRLGDIRHNFADLTKIQNMLGFTPKVNFEMGIEAFAEWVMNQRLVEDKYEESLEEMKFKGLFK